MNKWLFTALIILISGSLFAQNQANIKGLILDSVDKKPLELVTVGISNFKDSSFISYATTTKTGQFSFNNMPAEKPIVIIASMIGYRDFAKVVTLQKGQTLDLGTIYMSFRSKMLKDVTIQGQRQAIVLNKDTVEFRVEAFKVRPNAVVEELLKKLPGIQVDNDGTIKVNGKAVSKLLIDGKEFFGNDPKIASRNLDADLLDKVQVYDDRENDPDHLIPDAEVNKIINLKFKKAFKKSVFGKVYAGGGSRDRFESGALLNAFRDTLQVSLIGVGNNLNKTGFSYNDLSQQGGFNRSGQDALYNGSTNVGGRTYGGIEKLFSGGVNINYDIAKKFKANLMYFYNNSNVISDNSSLVQQFLTGDTLISANRSYADRTNSKHTVSGLVDWKPDTTVTIRYTPRLSFTDKTETAFASANRSNLRIPLNESTTNYSTPGNSMQFSHNFSYYRRLKKKGQSLNITHALSSNPDVNHIFNNFDLTSFTTTLNSETLRRLSDDRNNTASANLDINYRHPFTKKLTGDISTSAAYGLNTRALSTFDQNPATGQYTIFLDSQSSDLRRTQWTEGLKTGLTWNMNKLVTLEGSVTSQWLQIKNVFNKNVPDLHQKYFNLLPSARVRIGSSSVSYNTSISQPSVYNLQPITIRTSQLYAFTGNPYLKPVRRQNFFMNHYTYIPKRQLNIFTNGSFSFESNTVVTLRTLSPEGVSATTPVNRNGQYNLNIGGGFYKTFKKYHDFQLTFSPYAYFYQSRNVVVLNQDDGFQLNTSTRISASATVNWKDKVELNPSYSIGPQAISYTGLNFSDVKFTSRNFDTHYTVRLPKKIYWEGNYTYNYNPLVSEGFRQSSHLLNISVAYQMFKKDRGEIKLSCYDILDQNINSYRTANANSITDSQNQILKRYFLLTYMIKFNKTVTAK